MDIWEALLRSDKTVFTTRDAALLTNSGLSSVCQTLERLEEKNIVKKVLRGVWAVAGDQRFSPLSIVPYLNPSHKTYVSFVSAMHIHGMISQIPQMITCASTAHGRRVATPVGTFLVHQIEPAFFAGFEWHKSGNFLIATPEKALVDSLYIASRRGKRYSSFPEIEFPKNFKKRSAIEWLKLIKDQRLRGSVREKLEKILK